MPYKPATDLGMADKADLKTFAAHGCYGTSVVTALTAQNTMGVQGVHGAPPEFVAQQVRTSTALTPTFQNRLPRCDPCWTTSTCAPSR